jgi:hypothetical protein
MLPGAQVLRWLLRHHLPPRETNWALVVAILLAADWIVLMGLAIPVAVSRNGTAFRFALAQLPLMPSLAVGALVWLLAGLGPVENSPRATIES